MSELLDRVFFDDDDDDQFELTPKPSVSEMGYERLYEPKTLHELLDDYQASLVRMGDMAAVYTKQPITNSKILATLLRQKFPSGPLPYSEDEDTKMDIYEVRTIDSFNYKTYSGIVVSMFRKAEGIQGWYFAKYHGPSKPNRTKTDWAEFTEVIEGAYPVRQDEILHSAAELFNLSIRV